MFYFCTGDRLCCATICYMEELTFKEYAKKNPLECAPKAWVEDNVFLSRVGIEIPNKDNLPFGFVKLYPEDFIVEEITEAEEQLSIDAGTNDVDQSADDGETVYVTLVKYNLTTFEAERLLAEALGCEQKQISHAGIKDFRAVTAQRLSIRKVAIEIVKQVKHPQFFLKDIVQGKGVLLPGKLYGNRFTILIRTEDSFYDGQTAKYFTEHFKSVLDNGFNNFYYLQRFAAPRYNSARWGKLILLGEYEEAVQGMMTDLSTTELDFFTDVRKKLKEMWGDWQAMHEMLQTSVPHDEFHNERNYIKHLMDHPEDFLGALQTEAQHVKLCVHAFGAYLHNKQMSFLLKNNRNLPDSFPVVVSYKNSDMNVYRHLLQQEKAWLAHWVGLQNFPDIGRRPSRVKLKSGVSIESVDVVAEGIKMQFTLKKGEYATTFLSHLFNLLGGSLSMHPSVNMSTENITKLPGLTHEYFKPIIEDMQPE